MGKLFEDFEKKNKMDDEINDVIHFFRMVKEKYGLNTDRFVCDCLRVRAIWMQWFIKLITQMYMNLLKKNGTNKFNQGGNKICQM